jgi:hypothetical protein
VYQGEREVNGRLNVQAPYVNQDMRTSWFMPPQQQMPSNNNNNNNLIVDDLRQSYVPEMIGPAPVFQAPPIRESNGFSSEFDNNAMRISAATHYDARYTPVPGVPLGGGAPAPAAPLRGSQAPGVYTNGFY